MECGQERRKHFSLGPRAKQQQQQQAAFTDAMGRDARVDKCCSDRYLSVQIRVQNSPLSLRRRELRVLLLADVESDLKKMDSHSPECMSSNLVSMDMYFWCDEFENDKFESDKFI